MPQCRALITQWFVIRNIIILIVVVKNKIIKSEINTNNKMNIKVIIIHDVSKEFIDSGRLHTVDRLRLGSQQTKPIKYI